MGEFPPSPHTEALVQKELRLYLILAVQVGNEVVVLKGSW